MNQMDVLSDDVLLEIFDFYADKRPLQEGISSGKRKKVIEAWQLLVHACRRWRSLVLGSPRRLNLRPYCTFKTRIRDMLNVWPAFPLVVNSGGISSDTENIIAALRQSNRVCQVSLCLLHRKSKAVLAAMKVPFPELTDLRVWTFDTEPPVIPDSFLDGFAPRLRLFELNGTTFPGLPKLLLSATHLLSLSLLNIPYSGYSIRKTQKILEVV
jgi:hypothetical protein